MKAAPVAPASAWLEHKPWSSEVSAGLLLAGGRSHRMGGGDKCLTRLGGVTLLHRVIERVRPQVGALVLNANGDPARLPLWLPVVAQRAGVRGAAAGVLAGMEWWRRRRRAAVRGQRRDGHAVLSGRSVARLTEPVERGGAEVACAASGGRTHPVFALWPVSLAGELRRALVDEGMRKIDRWTARYRTVAVEFPCEPFDPFFNLNTPEDLALAEELLCGRTA